MAFSEIVLYPADACFYFGDIGEVGEEPIGWVTCFVLYPQRCDFYERLRSSRPVVAKVSLD